MRNKNLLQSSWSFYKLVMKLSGSVRSSVNREAQTAVGGTFNPDLEHQGRFPTPVTFKWNIKSQTGTKHPEHIIIDIGPRDIAVTKTKSFPS